MHTGFEGENSPRDSSPMEELVAKKQQFLPIFMTLNSLQEELS
jgi:hypothetical protein